MPIYTYECRECGQLFTSLEPVDGPSPTCECGGETVKRPSAAFGRVDGGTPRFHKWTKETKQ